MDRSIGLSPILHQYLMETLVVESASLTSIREDYRLHPKYGMQIAPEQGQLLSFLVKLTRAKVIMEIGVFLGYSSLWMLEALPADGRLIAFENNPEYAAIAEQNWSRAGVRQKVELHLGPALESLERIPVINHGTVDLAFVDADKELLEDYYEHVLALVRAGGLIGIDNAFMNGDVAAPAPRDARSHCVAAFTRMLSRDTRVEIVIIPIGDGLILARKL